MNKRKVVVYIATSLDGYIAKPDGDLSWLSTMENPPEDYGYADFISTIDTVLMGRKTYEKVLSFGIEFPHKGKPCYVFSRTRSKGENDVEFINSSPADFVRKLLLVEGKDIFIDGGAELIQALVQQDLIDTYIISVVPVLLGAGIPLFKNGSAEISLQLSASKYFASGLVQNRYERIR